MIISIRVSRPGKRPRGTAIASWCGGQSPWLLT
uniref:Uncharacterized protein n=1 Tax=Timema tahoe TaxID=61484 RepID=A0A7R9ISC2_9NEOP|nr:unnamed protein product [Timema tahoe]